MTDRDRLIELYEKALEEYEKTNKAQFKKSFICDYLLSNGVIVPPCKVGGVVYFIDTCITAEDFGKEYVAFEVVKRVSVDNGFIIFESGRIKLWEDVFLTKEEAEKALEERTGKNE